MEIAECGRGVMRRVEKHSIDLLVSYVTEFEIYSVDDEEPLKKNV